MTEKERPAGYDSLPKRFKDYVRELESKVYALQAAAPRKERTCVKIVSYMDKDAETFLPDDTRIEFRVGKNLFEVNIRSGQLKVTTPTGRLAVLPDVSNSITITAREH